MLNNLLRDKNFPHIFFDFESSGLNLAIENRPWQMGMLVCEGEKILEEHAFYIKWEPLAISEGAARVTKFNREEYEAKAVDAEPVLELIEKYFYDPKYRVIGHNVLGFDVFLHNIWRKVSGRKPDWSYLPRIIDTDALARGIKEDMKYKPGEDFLAYQYRAGSIIKKGLKTNLTALGKELNIDYDYDSLHGALADIRLNKIIWERWVKWFVDI